MKIYVLYGNEPYLIDFHKRKLVESISMPNLNVAYFESFGPEVVNYLATYPIIDNERVAFVSLSDIKDVNKSKLFEKTMSDSNEFATLCLLCNSCDKRASVYSKLQKMGCVHPCNKISDSEKIKKIIFKEISAVGGRITADAYNLFLARMNYQERDDITIYNILSELDKLLSYSKDITVETVELLIRENLVDNVFGIAKLLLAKDNVGLKQQAELLSQNPIGVLAALLREYRIAWKHKYFNSKEKIGVNYISLSSLSKSELYQGMSIITESIDGVKNGSIPENEVLFFTFMKLLHL